MLRRVKFDIEYINCWSLFLDIRILLKTPLALLSPQAY
jgi:putative colanic acid biosynthesis UDP-glucose lipid carrier transferase